MIKKKDNNSINLIYTKKVNINNIRLITSFKNFLNK